MKTLSIIKIGGRVIDQPESLHEFLEGFSRISSPKLLVHGGGASATQFAEKLGIPVQMVDGRRITDAAMLKVVVMMYAGWVNKQIVSILQSWESSAIGMCGADWNIIQATKRPAEPLDFGFVGDVKAVNAEALGALLEQGAVPIVAPITHDRQGTLLNTNADTITAELAKALSARYRVQVGYCFEKKGVLEDAEDDRSLLTDLSYDQYQNLKSEKKIYAGMIPKLDNAFRILQYGVSGVRIMHFADIDRWPGALQNDQYFLGTKLY